MTIEPTPAVGLDEPGDSADHPAMSLLIDGESDAEASSFESLIATDSQPETAEFGPHQSDRVVARITPKNPQREPSNHAESGGGWEDDFAPAAQSAPSNRIPTSHRIPTPFDTSLGGEPQESAGVDNQLTRPLPVTRRRGGDDPHTDTERLTPQRDKATPADTPFRPIDPLLSGDGLNPARTSGTVETSVGRRHSTDERSRPTLLVPDAPIEVASRQFVSDKPSLLSAGSPSSPEPGSTPPERTGSIRLPAGVNHTVSTMAPEVPQTISPNLSQIPSDSLYDAHGHVDESENITLTETRPESVITSDGQPSSTFEGSDASGDQAASDQHGDSAARPSLGEDILASVSRQSTTPDTESETAIRNQLRHTVEQVAQQILVSEASESADQTIHIVLKDSVLPETEVAVSRDGATLTVRFLTRSDDSAQLLTVHQRFLQDQLSQRLDCPVSVDVSAEQQDGRSRGQRDAFTEWEEERR